MKKIPLDEVPIQNNPLGVHSVRKPLSDELGTDDFACNYFETKLTRSCERSRWAVRDGVSRVWR